MNLPKITRNRSILGGKPIIAGTRVSVDLVMKYIVNGNTIENIKSDYPFLTDPQIKAALDFADRKTHRAKAKLEPTPL